MKYINKLNIDINNFIKKDFLKKIKIDELSVTEVYSFLPDKFKKIINENVDDYKKYIEETDLNDYQSINGYDKFYDFIVEKFLDQKYLTKSEAQRSFLTGDDFETEEKIYYLKYLDPLFFKSSKYAFLFLERKKYFSEDKLDPNIVKKLEKVILTNLDLSNEYAKKILKNRWEELELIIFQKGESKDFRDYFNNILQDFFKYDKDPSKKFDEIYKQSEIFRNFINHPIMISDLLSLFNFWNPTIDKILIKSAESYLDYFLNLIYSNFNNPEFMKKNIMKDPKKIAIYYSETSRGISAVNELPSDIEERQKIFDALSQYPEQLLKFVKNKYENDEDIFKDFPNFVSNASKVNEQVHYMIYNFLERTVLERIRKITDIFYWNQNKVDDYINNYQQQFKQVREYMYKTYKPFIEIISKNRIHSNAYANFTLYPFPIKEGEQRILNDFFERGSYLLLIKKLGPSIVPNYDSYDLSNLPIED
jgi:hypothetical protein